MTGRKENEVICQGMQYMLNEEFESMDITTHIDALRWRIWVYVDIVSVPNDPVTIKSDIGHHPSGVADPGL